MAQINTLNKSNFIFPNGVHTVLVTPFVFPTYEIDHDDIKSWFDFQASSDVDGLVLFGSTSEAGMLSTDEKMIILKNISKINSQLSKPKFITVGISGSNNITEVIDFAKQCAQYADAFMVTVPHYVKPTQEGIIAWFKRISNETTISNKPIIMYNIPSRTCVNMHPTTMKTIYDNCCNVVAVKEASGSMEQITSILNLIPNMKVFSGDDGMTMDVISNGGVGVISVASNIIPKLMTKITNCCLDKKYSEAKKIIDESSLDKFLNQLFCTSNPIPVKFMLYNLTIFKSYQMRLPLLPLDTQFHDDVVDALICIQEYQVE